MQRLHPFKGPRANLACTMGENLKKEGILGPGHIPACIVPALHDKVLNTRQHFSISFPVVRVSQIKGYILNNW